MQAPTLITTAQPYCIQCVLGMDSKIDWDSQSDAPANEGMDEPLAVSALPFIRCDELDFGFCITARTADLTYKLARQFHGRNQITAAIAAYRKALRQNPNHFEAIFCLASALLTENTSVDEAVEMHRQAITAANFNLADSDSTDLQTASRAFTNLGVALYNRGSFDEAISLWTQAVAMDADCVLAHLNVVRVLLAPVYARELSPIVL
jgi:tetratricopeptide (TPR) repeat protein